MGRLAVVVLCSAAVMTAWSPALRGEGAQTQATPDREGQAEELVRDLGAPKFAVRKRAMDGLVDLGVAAIPALEQGVQSADREIRFRSQRALAVIREHDFQRRLTAFAVGRDEGESYQLPGWALFRKEVGFDERARSLFVEMQRAEPELLRSVERSSDEVVETLLSRLAEVQEQARQGRKSDQLSLGSITTFLFIVNQLPVGAHGLTELNFGSYFALENFSGAIQSSSYRDVLRKMLGKWIEDAEGWDAYYAILLSLQYDLSEGLAPARRMLENDASDSNRGYMRGYALQAFAKFGDESQFPVIEPLLNDDTLYTPSGSVTGKAKYRLQIRDIALATLVHLAKQDPKQFGLARLKLMSGSSQMFNTNTIAFEDDAQRDEAIKKWRAFRAKSH